jgi:hypothetical protein
VVFRSDTHQSVTSVRTTWYSVWTLFCQSIIRPDDEIFPSGHPSMSRSFEQFKIVSVLVNRPDALQSSRRFQCSNASIRMTWLYRPDAIQCLTSIRKFDSRHNYRKTAATVQKMCDHVWMMSSIRQVVHTKFNHPDVSLHGLDDQASYMEIVCTSSTVRTSPFKVRTLQSLIMVITCSQSATVRKLGQHRPEAALLWKLSMLFWKGGCS